MRLWQGSVMALCALLGVGCSRGAPISNAPSKATPVAALPAPAASSMETKSVVDMREDRLMTDIRWLADPAREGRGVGTAGLEVAGAYIEQRFRDLRLTPMIDAGDGRAAALSSRTGGPSAGLTPSTIGEASGYRQSFVVTTGLQVRAETSMKLADAALGQGAFAPAGFSSNGEAKGDVVLAGYGVVAPDLGVDDYAKLDVKGKIVLVRRFVPEGGKFEGRDAERRHGDLRQKAWAARERGAKALIVVDAPVAPIDAPKDWKAPDEAPLARPEAEGYGDAGLPVLMVKRAALGDAIERLAKKQRVRAEVKVELARVEKPAFNVVGKIAAGAPSDARLPGVIVLGAHYDHLGLGGRDSLAPDEHVPHGGADDNASGTAALLESARWLVDHAAELRRDVVVVAFSGEESGVLGSTHFTRSPPAGLALTDVVAMINMDMVGRMQENKLSALGTDSAEEWASLVLPLCARANVACTTGGDGFGPSDQTPFYAAGVPVVQFFTGAHPDYHKPSDTADKINAVGVVKTTEIAASLVVSVAARDNRLTVRSVPSPPPRGDMRSFHASLGTIPDYAGPPNGQKGVLLAGVRPGGAAQTAGLARGDILIRLGAHEIGSVEDLMYALNALRPGEKLTATVLRDAHPVTMDVILQEARRH